MPDIWMDVDTALSEVPVNVFPLTDDTDFKAREESVVYNQAGMDLLWNFVTTGGAYTQTAVTPTTGGDYDWANQGNGMYSIEIPASGGASINNDTEGFGWFSGFATGILPWRGPVIGFRAAGLNNILVDSAYSATRGLSGTALPDAVADGAGGLPISDAGGLDIDTILGRITANVALASVCTEARLSEFDAANIPADIDSLLTRLSAARAGYLDKLNIGAETIAHTGNATSFMANVSALATAAKLLAYIQLLARSDAAIETDNSTELTEINADGGSGAGNYSAQTDSGEAVRDHIGDGTNLTEAGGDGDHLTEAGGTGDQFTAMPWNPSWDAEVQSECTDALNAYDSPTKAEMDSGFAGLNDLSAADVNAEVDTALEDYDGPTNAEFTAGLAGLNDITAAEVKTAMEAVGSHLALVKVVTDALTSAAATKLALSAGTIVAGTVSHDNTAATTTVFYSDDITEATADHYNGRIVIFTSGALQYQATDITDYALESGEGKFTVTALTEAPADNVTFIII